MYIKWNEEFFDYFLLLFFLEEIECIWSVMIKFWLLFCYSFFWSKWNVYEVIWIVFDYFFVIYDVFVLVCLYDCLFFVYLFGCLVLMFGKEVEIK